MSNTNHAQFTHYVKGHVCCVIDIGHCQFVSVTNDAEFVVKRMIECYGNIPIVYRDSTGQWDQLLHDGTKFTGYEILAQDSGDKAISALKQEEN